MLYVETRAMDASPDQHTHATLAAQLLAPDRFEAFAADCRTLIAEQVKHKGMTLRTTVGVVRRIKPDILERLVREIMPDFLAALEPLHADFQAGAGDDFCAHLSAHDDAVAEAAVQAGDRRADRIQNRAIRSAYDRVRGRAKTEIRPVVPALAVIIDRHRPRG